MMRLSRRGFGLAAFGFVAGASRFGRASPSDAGPSRTIYVQPLGPDLPDRELDVVTSALRGFYDGAVVVLPSAPLPKAAFYPPRQRYRAEKLLDELDRRLPQGGWRIVGVTSVDISTTKGPVPDWGILGLAHAPGPSCVVSSFRCKRRASGLPHATIRLGKVAVHEAGHTFGLDHCRTRGCLMEDAGGSVLTTDREYDLCDRCRAFLLREAALRTERAIPWEKPE